MFLKNVGPYRFQPYAFTVSGGTQWSLMTTADLDRDGRPDVIIGAMRLDNIARIQRTSSRRGLESERDPILVLENRMNEKVNK